MLTYWNNGHQSANNILNAFLCKSYLIFIQTSLKYRQNAFKHGARSTDNAFSMNMYKARYAAKPKSMESI